MLGQEDAEDDVNRGHHDVEDEEQNPDEYDSEEDNVEHTYPETLKPAISEKVEPLPRVQRFFVENEECC
jgi:hypothetical protein